MRDSVSVPATSWLRFVGVVAALGFCGGAQWYVRHRFYWSAADAALVGGALLAALLLGKPEPGAPDPMESLSSPSRRHRYSWVYLLSAVLGFGVFAYAIWLLFVDWNHNFDLGAPLVIAGVTLWSLGLALWEGRRPAGRVPVTRWELVLVLAIVALGFFLRFYRYDYFPPDGVCAVEEPQAGQTTHRILMNTRPWEFVGDRWLPVPFFLLMGETLTALRLPFTLMSALTVPVLYLLLRQLVSRGAALFCAALFAMCSWHLIYARLAHNIFATTLVVVLLLAMCVRVHRRGGFAWYPWIGFLSGYTLYCYAGYRGTTLLVGLFLIISFLGHVRTWRARIVPRTRSMAGRVVALQAAGLGLALLAFAGPVAVLFPHLRNNPEYYFEAANRSLLNKGYYTSDVHAFIQQRITRLQGTARIFNHVGDDSPTFNLPDAPMLDPITGALFVLGLAYCVVWPRHRWQGYFAFIFIFLLLGSSTFVQNLDVRRMQGIIPLIFVLIAFAVDRFAQLSAGCLGRRVAYPLLIGLATVTAALTLASNYTFYFHTMINNLRVRQGFQNRYTVAIRYAHTLPRNAYLFFVTDVVNFFMDNDFAWLRGNLAGTATADMLPLFTGEDGPWTGHDLYVLIQDPHDGDALVRLLRQRFPTAQCEVVSQPDDPPGAQMSACRLPPTSGGGFEKGVRARYFRGKDPDPFLERMEPVISYAFLPLECQTLLMAPDVPPCRVEWEGIWETPEAGDYQFALDVRQGHATLSIDGRQVARSAQVELSAGPHLIQVRAQYGAVRENGARLRWFDKRTQRWELVQFAVFEREPEGS
jgi:hypothetical protein